MNICLWTAWIRPAVAPEAAEPVDVMIRPAVAPEAAEPVDVMTRPAVAPEAAEPVDVMIRPAVAPEAAEPVDVMIRPLADLDAAEPFDAMTRHPVPLEPTITVVQAPPSPEPVERRPHLTSPVPPSPASAPPAKRRKIAGHKVGFESSWAIERPWVFCAEEDGVEVLMCKLCTTHKPVEMSMQHRDAVRGN